MIEEDEQREMDRKNSNRTSSAPPKSSGAGGGDTKKTESSNGTSRQRYNKKREPIGSRQRPDNGATARRPVPQKSRTSTDKRPRSRGFSNDRQREEVDYGGGVEPGTALQKGSKKGNLNHLLNFTYAPRDSQENRGARSGGFYGRGARRGRNKPRYNKEQFLQANCQFIVRGGGDYTIHSVDPDKLVDWELVEQVRLSSSELPSCPICLHPPIAAKITKCGHIYCSSCMLHYLALGEKSWRKCPICYEAINKAHLKSVQTVCVPRYKVGDEITFQLMKKEKGSTLVFPNMYWKPREGKPLSLHDDNGWPSANLLVASDEEILELIIEPERKALERQLKSDPEDSEICFIESSLALLKERSLMLKSLCTLKEEVSEILAKVEPQSLENDSTTPEKQHSSIVHPENIVTYSDAFDEEFEITKEEDQQGDITQESNQQGETTDNDSSLDAGLQDENGNSEDIDTVLEDIEENCLPVEEAVECLSVTPEDSESPRQADDRTTFYYFYQAKDGQHIYIHALNVRCLVREYGSLEKCPEMLTATVVEIETIFMTEELRKRLRYLCHLPLTCEFQVAEVQLKPPVVSPDTLQLFSGELQRRNKLRQKKHREETKQIRRIEQQEKQKQGIYPGLNIPLTSHSQFPSTSPQQSQLTESMGRVYSPATSQSTNSSPMISPTSSQGLNVFANEFIPGEIGQSAGISPTWPTESNSNTLSFASMLKEGKARPKVWPKAGKSEAKTPVQRSPDSDVSDNEDKIPVPEFHSAFEDAIQQAFDKLSLNKVAECEPENKMSGKGKKKKKQKTLLFTTTMTRGK